MTHKHGIDLKDAQSLKSNIAVVKSRKDEMVRTLNGFLGLFEQFRQSFSVVKDALSNRKSCR